MLHTPSSSIVLGFFSISHLGDVICTTTLPRKIFQTHHKMVHVVHHSSTVGAFANNPYVAGFRNEGYMSLSGKMAGPGHIIQKLERGMGVPVDPVPKPELYFSDEELQWAWEQRSQWPRDKPVCILSTGAFTDSAVEPYSQLAWNLMAGVLGKWFTIVQPLLTSLDHYASETVVNDVLARGWEPDEAVEGAITYLNLPLRRYMVLFAVADAHCGPTAGGPHIAAAVGIPALIVLNRIAHPQNVVFPLPQGGMIMESFLYAQHRFVWSDNLYASTFDEAAFSGVVERWVTKGCSQGQSPSAWEGLAVNA